MTGRQVLERPKPTADDLPCVIPGGFVSNDVGRFYLHEKFTPADKQRGRIPVSSLAGLSSGDLARLSPDRLLTESDKPVVFLDTETTGLAGGTGTYAFLVGIGYWRGDGFVVEQYFMSDYDEEPALLTALSNIDERFSALVTYNGRTFDVPLLRSRFLMNRLRSPFDRLPHVDLLGSSRRIWSRSLESCSLSSVEEQVLGIRRSGDVPGAIIPSLYFNFLKRKNPEPLKPVFSHNAQDILSLALLTWRVSEMLANPLEVDMPPMDLFSVGRLMEQAQSDDVALACYERVRQSHPGTKAARLARLNLAVLHKRLRRWDKCVPLWKEAFQDSKEGVPYRLYRDCAIYLEHVKRQHKNAIAVVQEALDRLELDIQLGRPATMVGSRDSYAVRADFLHRLLRLTRKRDKQPGTPLDEGRDEDISQKSDMDDFDSDEQTE